jgi:hypothetical protein
MHGIVFFQILSLDIPFKEIISENDFHWGNKVFTEIFLLLFLRKLIDNNFHWGNKLYHVGNSFDMLLAIFTGNFAIVSTREF